MAGYCKNRCFDPLTGIMMTGYLTSDDTTLPFCIDTANCPTGFICGKMNYNPLLGVINFDIIGWSML